MCLPRKRRVLNSEPRGAELRRPPPGTSVLRSEVGRRLCAKHEGGSPTAAEQALFAQPGPRLGVAGAPLDSCPGRSKAARAPISCAARAPLAHLSGSP